MDQQWTSTLVLGLLSAPLPLCDLGKTLSLGLPLPPFQNAADICDFLPGGVDTGRAGSVKVKNEQGNEQMTKFQL